MGLHPDFLSNVPAIAFPSVGTCYSPTKTTGASGQERRTFTNVVYPSILCRKVPVVLDRVTGTKKVQGGFTREQVDFVILCRGAYEKITPECEFVITGDSNNYNVVSIDIDGNGLMTRLRVTVMKPYVR